MTCNKAQSMITPFINNKLGIKEMEVFLLHVDSCANCKEELEFYYTLLTAMKQLDEDKNLSNNYNNELAVKIKRAQDKIKRAKYTYYRKKIILVFVMLSLAFVLGIRYGEKRVVISKEERIKFEINRMYQDQRYEFARYKLKEYYLQQGIENVPLPDFNDNWNIKKTEGLTYEQKISID